MKIIIFEFVIFFAIVTVCVPFSTSADNVPADVLNATQEGLKIFVKDLPKNKLPRFGFITQQDLDDAIVGQGFQSFAVAPDRLLNSQEDSADLNSLLI